MLFSERLLSNSYRPNATIYERTTAGGENVYISTDGIYDIVLVGGGGLSRAAYGGDSIGGNWRGVSGHTGGSGGVCAVRARLNRGTYHINVGCTAQGTYGTYQNYQFKEPAGWGSTDGNTYISLNNSNLLVAWRGGTCGYRYTGNQPNDGARYVFEGTASGGGYSVNISVISNNSYNGAGGTYAYDGDWQDGHRYITSPGGSWNGYGKPHSVDFGYRNYSYEVNAIFYGKTDGYARIIYRGER